MRWNNITRAVERIRRPNRQRFHANESLRAAFSPDAGTSFPAKNRQILKL
jgi:hypothetical protein